MDSYDEQALIKFAIDTSVVGELVEKKLLLQTDQMKTLSKLQIFKVIAQGPLLSYLTGIIKEQN